MVLSTCNSIVLLFFCLFVFFSYLSNASIWTSKKEGKIKYRSSPDITKRANVERKYKLLFLKRTKNEKNRKKNKKDINSNNGNNGNNSNENENETEIENDNINDNISININDNINDNINRNDDNGFKKNEIDNILFRNNIKFPYVLFRRGFKEKETFEIIVPIERTGTLARCCIIDIDGITDEQNKLYKRASQKQNQNQNQKHNQNQKQTKINKKIKQTNNFDIDTSENGTQQKKRRRFLKKEKIKNKLINELEEVTKTNEQRAILQKVTQKAKINTYINEQLLQIMNEIIILKKKREKEEKEEKEQREKRKNDIMKWDFYITTKEKPLNCFIYFELPENTTLLKPSEIEDPKFRISINALNDIRRNNKDILKNIYFNKYNNITFDYIYKNCNFLTLLLNKILDQPYILNVTTISSLISSLYIFRNTFYQLVLHFLSSQLMWNYAIYNIWFNMYYTTLPLKLFFLKQAFSYSKMGTDFINMFLKTHLIRLETYFINRSLKNKMDLEKIPKNKYDQTKFQIATTTDIHLDEMEEDGDFIYV